MHCRRLLRDRSFLFYSEVMYFVNAFLYICKYRGTEAEVLKTAFDNLLINQIQDSSWKVVSTTTDGTRVHIISKNKFYAGMKNNDHPWLLRVHCVNYNIELTEKMHLKLQHLSMWITLTRVPIAC